MTLPKDLPSPPKSIILLTTQKSAVKITDENLRPFTNDGTVSILAAAVDSLPGSSEPGTRVEEGHSWLVTDYNLHIKLPPVKELTRSISFSLPSANITVPLANTVFQNGAKSTLLHIPIKVKEVPVRIEAATGLSENDALEFAHAQQDIKEAWDEMGELVKLIAQRAGVVATKEHEIGTVEVIISSQVIAGDALKTHIPLKPLTSPRRIAAGMGNILKQLDSKSGKAEGASRELEKVVPEYVETLPDGYSRLGKVGVFARITPHSPTLREDLFTTPGVRIHRVLSGGGGWGSKAGLLSLDPQGESDVGEFAQNFENSLLNAAGHPGEAQKPQTGIVVPGQYVQFFVAETPVKNATEAKGIRFGAVPKVEYIIDVTEKPGEEIIDGLFGGMAEQGVWVGGKLMDIPFGEVEAGAGANKVDETT